MYQLYYYNTILTLVQPNPRALTPSHPHTPPSPSPTLKFLEFQNFREISGKFHQTRTNVHISILTLGLKHMKILEISKKFQGNFIKHNNECIHILANPRLEIYGNFRNFREISSNTRTNVQISILTLGLKYMKILEISKKFQGNFIKHNNEYIHIHPNPRPEIYGNFGNFKEILGKFRQTQ